ncbi:MAG TPA: hypothetical protein VHV30_07225 [Polyangiaceae bacterium]|jgi:hypothetical protein|nr:hypothetical protein [Polyangiaceae bacterium]
MRFAALLVLSASLAAVAAAPDAAAVGTRTFELDSLEKLSGGDVKGVSIGSDGVVRAGWTIGNVPLPADAGTTATCAVGLADGSVLVGTGPASGGKVVRIAADQASVFADTKESAVTALAVDRAGAVYAGTTSGRIYKVTQGKAQLFATLAGVDNVFALAVDKAGTGLYAGTGAEGVVMHVEPSGASSVYFKADDPFVVSLAVAADGAVYAGTSGKGLLYRIASAGHATVLYDFPGSDVHAIALGPNGSVYAVVNEEPSSSSSENESSSSRRSSARSPAGPATIPKPKPGKGNLWRFDARGRPERMMHHDDFHFMALAVDDRGVAFVGTGAEGRVYSVDDTHTVSLMADLDDRQATAVGVAGKTRFVLGSDPAVFHRVLAVGGADAVWTSKTLDAGLRARFGHMTWRSSGSIEVSTRSGDTSTPDGTWSAWQGPVPPGGAVGSPPGRFVQVRARLRDASASIADVTLAFATENLRAVVTDVEAHEKGVTRETKEGLTASGAEPPKHDSVVHVSWKVDNPDSDELRYRVQFRREGQARWIDATPPDDVLTKTELDWDTTALPEGSYRVRVDASDEIANAPEETTHHALESAPVLVDNTPPVFKAVAMNGRRLHAEVVDGVGPIARVEVAIDGKPAWRPLAAADGIFDTAAETVDADLTSLLPPGPGPHIVAVRAFDAAGNAAVREIEAP